MPSGVYTRTPEIIKSLSLAGKKRGVPIRLFTPEAIEKRAAKRRGMKFDAKWKENLSKAHIGQKAWNTGIQYELGEEHWNWSGDEVGYRGIHHWIIKRLGKPTTCAHCGETDLVGHKIHWANLSGKYKRDISDWMRLCARCHKRMDVGKLQINKQTK
jgi:hypothetical protein